MRTLFKDASLVMNSCILPREDYLDYFSDRLSDQISVRDLHEARKRSKRFFDEDPNIADDRMACWINDHFSVVRYT